MTPGLPVDQQPSRGADMPYSVRIWLIDLFIQAVVTKFDSWRESRNHIQANGSDEEAGR